MISRREPHRIRAHEACYYRPTAAAAAAAAHNPIIQILTAAFYGSPLVFLVRPTIFIANRRSIRVSTNDDDDVTTAAATLRLGYAAPRMLFSLVVVEKVARFGANVSFATLAPGTLHTRRPPNRRANINPVPVRPSSSSSSFSRLRHFPPARARISLMPANFHRTPARQGECIAKHTAKYGAAETRSRFASARRARLIVPIIAPGSR